MRFIGHLDLIRAFERAFRRSDLPIGYSEGFNPRQKLAWGPPLSLGIESECELVDVTFERWVKPEEVKTALNTVLPPGLEILDAALGNPQGHSIVEDIKRAEFEVTLDPQAYASGLKLEQLNAKINEFEKAASIAIVRERSKGAKSVDLKKLAHSIKLDQNMISIVGEASNNGSLKIFELTDWLGIARESMLLLRRTRLR